MNRKWVSGLSGLMILGLGLEAGALAQGNAKPSAVGPGVAKAAQRVAEPQSAASEAAAAIDQAAKDNKYMFVFFYKDEDQATEAARKSFEAAMAKFADRATSTTVNASDPTERVLVTKYGMTRSPLPLVMALAPNGAVTRSFTGEITDAQLETAFVSAGMQKTLKGLQERKTVFVCFQNGQTQHNTEAMLGVREFAADPQYAARTEIITLDPTDAAEKSFIETLKLELTTDEATTVMMAPPGKIVGAYTGATSKDVFIAAAKGAASGCAPGAKCAPGKCGPAPKKP